MIWKNVAGTNIGLMKIYLSYSYIYETRSKAKGFILVKRTSMKDKRFTEVAITFPLVFPLVLGLRYAKSTAIG